MLYSCQKEVLHHTNNLLWSKTRLFQFHCPTPVCSGWYYNTAVKRVLYWWRLALLCFRLLQGGSSDSKGDEGPQFAEVFVIIWFGSVIITLNSKLLGGTMWVDFFCATRLTMISWFAWIHFQCCKLNCQQQGVNSQEDSFSYGICLTIFISLPPSGCRMVLNWLGLFLSSSM